MSRWDKRLAFGFYMAAFILVFTLGTRMVNFALDMRLYKDFLSPWKAAYEQSRRVTANWPAFTGDNHVAHMEALSRIMTTTGITVPDSNTDRAYIFELDKFWWETQRLFLLCHKNQLIIYGLSADTAVRVDGYVDGPVDFDDGYFRAVRSKDDQTFIGYWKL